MEALTGFSHVFSPDGLIMTYSFKATFLKMAPTVRLVGRVYILKTGE